MVGRFDEPPRDLPDLLGRLARHAADTTGVIDAGVGPVSWGELWRRTRGLAERLAAAGIGPGDCVAVWLPNWSDALCWQFAAAARGAHVIGVNTRYNVDEVAHVLDSARPALLAVAHGFHGLDLADRLHEAARQAQAPAPAVAVVAGPGRPAAEPIATTRYDVGGGAWAVEPPSTEPPPLEPSDLDRLAVAFTTSGSTGKPKLAAHRAAGVLSHAMADAEVIGLTSEDVVLCAIPLAGTFGFSTAMAALAGGATLLLVPVFDADAVLDDMVRHRVSHVMAGDDLVLRLRRARASELPSWRWWGGADFQGRLRELAQWATKSFGTVTTGLYGSSEIFALAAMWPPEVPAPRRWDAGGHLVAPEIEVRVADPVSERVLPPGAEGELQFRGPNVVDGYLGNPDAAARAFTEDGWFRSGDLGVLVERGVFRYVCRMGDALRLRGFLVDPAEIELRLAEHDGVETAKVVGIPGPDGDTRAVGFVVPAPGSAPTPDQLRAWCAQALAAFKVPDAVHVIDEMPTTSGTNGTKIRAATLREWARQRA